MTAKPANLIYGVEDNPSIGATILLAVQHILIAVIYLVYPVIVVAEAGGTRAEAAFCIQMSMLAIGLGTILQVRSRGLVGSGFLIPHVTTAAYLIPSLIAVRVGGMALVLGMTIVAGIFEGILSRFMKKMRVLFPPEVSGVVVAMIGFSLAKVAISRFVGLGGSDSIIELAELWVGGVTLPKFSVILTLMPAPVMGAGLLYVASYLIASGIQLIMSRMMDSRRTFIVGLSFLAGISLEVVPALHQNLPDWANAIFGSSLTVATLMAFSLNLIFRIGVSQKASLLLSSQLDAGAEIYRFLEGHGATWGARQQVIHEAKHILRELIEALYMHRKTEGPVHIEALFDEYNLNIGVSYKGEPMAFPASPPTEDELMLDKSSLAKMVMVDRRYFAFLNTIPPPI